MDSSDFLRAKCLICKRDIDICLITDNLKGCGMFECENGHYCCIKHAKTHENDPYDVWNKKHCPVCIKKAAAKKKAKEAGDVFTVQCQLNGTRKLTHKLSTEEARNFRIAARHLVKYLTEEYELDGK